MEVEINSNDNNNINDEKICPYCNIILSSKIFQDHIFCHEIDQNENGQVNNINNYNINNNDNNNNNESDNQFGSKIKGFLDKIGGKVDTFIKEEKEEPFNKIKSFFGNIKEKIEQKKENDKNKTFQIHNIRNERLEQIRNRNRLEINRMERERNNNRLEQGQINNRLEQNRHNNRLENNRNNINNNRVDNEIYRAFLNRRNRNRNRIRDRENFNAILAILEEEDERINERRNNLFKEDVKEIMRYIPVSEVKEKNQENGIEFKCMICLDDINIGEKESTLPCLHIFHPDCLEKWIERKRLCPVCKYDISLESLLKNNFG